MSFTREQLKLLLDILNVYIPIASPYVKEETIEQASQIRESIKQELDDE